MNTFIGRHISSSFKTKSFASFSVSPQTRNLPSVSPEAVSFAHSLEMAVHQTAAASTKTSERSLFFMPRPLHSNHPVLKSRFEIQNAPQAFRPSNPLQETVEKQHPSAPQPLTLIIDLPTGFQSVLNSDISLSAPFSDIDSDIDFKAAFQQIFIALVLNGFQKLRNTWQNRGTATSVKLADTIPFFEHYVARQLGFQAIEYTRLMSGVDLQRTSYGSSFSFEVEIPVYFEGQQTLRLFVATHSVSPRKPSTPLNSGNLQPATPAPASQVIFSQVPPSALPVPPSALPQAPAVAPPPSSEQPQPATPAPASQVIFNQVPPSTPPQNPAVTPPPSSEQPQPATPAPASQVIFSQVPPSALPQAPAVAATPVASESIQADSAMSNQVRLIILDKPSVHPFLAFLLTPAAPSHSKHSAAPAALPKEASAAESTPLIIATTGLSKRFLNMGEGTSSQSFPVTPVRQPLRNTLLFPGFSETQLTVPSLDSKEKRSKISFLSPEKPWWLELAEIIPEQEEAPPESLPPLEALVEDNWTENIAEFPWEIILRSLRQSHKSVISSDAYLSYGSVSAENALPPMAGRNEQANLLAFAKASDISNSVSTKNPAVPTGKPIHQRNSQPWISVRPANRTAPVFSFSSQSAPSNSQLVPINPLRAGAQVISPVIGAQPSVGGEKTSPQALLTEKQEMVSADPQTAKPASLAAETAGKPAESNISKPLSQEQPLNTQVVIQMLNHGVPIQVADFPAFVNQVLQTRNFQAGVLQSIEVQLHPQNLGTVNAHFTLNTQNEMIVRLYAPNAAAVKTLESYVQEIQQMIQRSSLVAGQIEIKQGIPPARQPQSQNNSGSGQSNDFSSRQSSERRYNSRRRRKNDDLSIDVTV